MPRIRIIDPPIDQLPNLPTPLTDGERQVLELFNAKLPEEWEIYVQPYLNGLRPDFVLLNPNVGIAVFEVKDWNLDAMDYQTDSGRDGVLRLTAHDSVGKKFVIENPVDKVRRYKEAIYELYCPSLPEKSGYASITAGVIFTNALHSRVAQLLNDFYTRDELQYSNYYPIAGSDDIASGNIKRLFPEGSRQSSRWMSPEEAEYLRGWVKEPDYSREQREPLELNQRQQELATTRTIGGYRRVKGPAGSGKTLVIAARAAELADDGKNILAVTFNITLMNYIKDMTVRYRTSREVIRRQIEFIWFHRWCRQVCECGNRVSDYRELFSGAGLNDDVLNRRIAELTQEIYDSPRGHDVPYYDAILVDEGQDFSILWWDTLRKALKPQGEMLLVADKTQNIYGRAKAWTDAAMTGAGFRGPWFSLETTYRLPRDIVPILRRYADSFLVAEEVDIPKQIAPPGPTDLRWIQINPANSVTSTARICVAQTRRQMKTLFEDTAMPDIVFLSQHDEIGREFVCEFVKHNTGVVHTFDADDRESRRQKLRFFKGAPSTQSRQELQDRGDGVFSWHPRW